MSRIHPSVARGTVPVLVACVLAGCAATSTRAPSQIETVDATGFTITEDVRLGGDERASYDRAVQLLAAGQLDAGIALLSELTAQAPNVTALHINLGIAHSREEDFEEAEASFNRALALNPRHPIAHNELGMLYRRTGRFAQARTSYEQALALHPGFHYARRNLAILCDIYLKDLDCALENYERYAAAVPNDAEASMWIADVRNRATPKETP